MAPSCNTCGGFSRPYVKYIPWWTGNAVSVICGPDGPKQRKFDIHIKALFNVSPLFANRMNEPLESHPAILLPHIPPRILDSFSTWLYLGTVPQVKAAADILALCQMWVACQNLGAYPIQNKLLDIVRESLSVPPSPTSIKVKAEVVEWVFRNTEAGCRLRGFIVACFVQRGESVGGLGSRAFEELGVWHEATKAITRVERMRMENPRNPLLPPSHPLHFYPAYKQEEGKLPVIDFENTKWVLPEVLILGDDGKTDVGDFEVKSDDLAIIEAKKAAKLVEEGKVVVI